MPYEIIINTFNCATLIIFLATRQNEHEIYLFKNLFCTTDRIVSVALTAWTKDYNLFFAQMCSSLSILPIFLF